MAEAAETGTAPHIMARNARVFVFTVFSTLLL
jgi:hypothetical protein